MEEMSDEELDEKRSAAVKKVSDAFTAVLSAISDLNKETMKRVLGAVSAMVIDDPPDPSSGSDSNRALIRRDLGEFVATVLASNAETRNTLEENTATMRQVLVALEVMNEGGAEIASAIMEDTPLDRDPVDPFPERTNMGSGRIPPQEE